jgi:hypothetical protein
MHICHYRLSWTRIPQIVQSKRAFLLRLCLVPFAVFACYRFDWHWLRELTADLTVRCTVLAGVHWTRVGQDLAMFREHLYRFAIGCTLVDAWFGAIPLIWRTKDSVLSNLAYAGTLALAMFALNISRLTLVNVIFASGLPWQAVHDSLSGLTYLVVWIVIQRRKAWREPSRSSSTNQDQFVPDSDSVAQVPNPV